MKTNSQTCASIIITTTDHTTGDHHLEIVTKEKIKQVSENKKMFIPKINQDKTIKTSKNNKKNKLFKILLSKC